MSRLPVDVQFEKKFKIIFVMYNLVLWSSGLVLLWFGVWLEVELPRFIRLDAQAVSYLLMATGCLIVMYNSISCFCVLKGVSSSFLSAYGLVLGCIFVCEIILSISMLWLKQNLQRKFDAHLVSVHDKNIDLNVIQASLKCCGIRGITDWTAINATIPVSCCATDFHAHCDTRNLSHLWKDGCLSKLSLFFDQNVGTITLLILVFAAINLIGVFCSFSWAKKFSNTYEVIE